MVEEVVGSLNVRISERKGGHLLLLFTSRRIIGAHTGAGLNTAGSISGTLLLGPAGIAIMGPGMAKEAALKRSEELMQLKPSDILAADEANFQIPNSDLVKIEAARSRWQNGGTLRFVTKAGTREFSLLWTGLDYLKYKKEWPLVLQFLGRTFPGLPVEGE